MCGVLPVGSALTVFKLTPSLVPLKFKAGLTCPATLVGDPIKLPWLALGLASVAVAVSKDQLKMGLVVAATGALIKESAPNKKRPMSLRSGQPGNTRLATHPHPNLPPARSTPVGTPLPRSDPSAAPEGEGIRFSVCRVLTSPPPPDWYLSTPSRLGVSLAHHILPRVGLLRHKERS